jgi:hypothetical protein
VRNHHRVIVLICLAVLAVAPTLNAAEGSAGTATKKGDQALERLCSITVDCGCVNEQISCIGPVGSCLSGGSGCEEWVQCGSNPRQYCPDPPPPECGPVPACSELKACYLWCAPFRASCDDDGCCVCFIDTEL